MFNSYQNQQNIKINAISGTIMKNYKESFFKRFHLQSELANNVLAHNPKYPLTDYVSKPVVVLQMMVCGDMEVVAELMFKDDFDKLFKADAERRTDE